ncbi:WD repeat-containing protein 24 [Bulinus truncatus]|nr:WD repeat-containing protein 24 [Bulinus truncatus]
MMQLSNVSKKVHDKAPVDGQHKSLIYNCEGPLNSLAVNKDFTQVVVAGRSVFKILNIKDDCFSENVNLRVGRHINLTYSAADVAWHPSDENMLASAATNGCVVIWNLCKSAKSKQASIYQEHKRSVNRVVFHSAEHNQLLSASQDGIVMIHDVRKAGPCSKFGTLGTDSAKDAQFFPLNIGYFMFASAYESGAVQTWDMRRPDRPEKTFMAHNGPIFSLDWHPADKIPWLATAGRDKTIKIWDMSKLEKPHPGLLHVITNIASVGYIRWRPNRKNHISSCSLLVDHSVNVWDIGRPYIPFASFEGHSDVATCIEWRDDSHTFLSCGRDGNIIQHVFADAKRPADRINPAGVDISSFGFVGFAHAFKKDHSTSSSGRSKKISKSRQFSEAQSGLCVWPDLPNHFSEEDKVQMTMMPAFVEIAKEYKLEGTSLVDMCIHNGNIAAKYKKNQVAEMWNLLAEFYDPYLCSQPGQSHINRLGPLGLSNAQLEKKDELAVKPVLKRGRDKEKKKMDILTHNDITSGSNDDSSDVEGESSELEKNNPEPTPEANFLFGDGGEDEMNKDFYSAGGILSPGDYNWSHHPLPNEGFQLRHELNPMTGTHPLMEESDLTLVSMLEPIIPLEDLDQNAEPTLVITCSFDHDPMDFTSIVADTIKDLAEEGDVQTCVSMLIVLGELIKPHLDEAYQESWFYAYIDLLGRYKLWTIANVVIKQSKLASICSLNQESTVVHTMCYKCSRACERSAWLCDKCKRVTDICSICHHPVKGNFVWCQGCCHGGHADHMEQWFSISDRCPAGCDHLCEFI